jgi:hypothetical protein
MLKRLCLRVVRGIESSAVKDGGDLDGIVLVALNDAVRTDDNLTNVRVAHL